MIRPAVIGAAGTRAIIALESINTALEFCPSAKVSYTKGLAKYVLALRAEMSIRATAKHAGLHWQSVKNIEKTLLARMYGRISLELVRRLGIDEIYLGRNLEDGERSFLSDKARAVLRTLQKASFAAMLARSKWSLWTCP